MEAVVLNEALIDEAILKDVDAIAGFTGISSLLDVVCRTTGMGFAAIARVTEEKWVVCSVKDNYGMGLAPGGELKLETTICNEIRQHHQPVIIDHVAEDPCFKDHHTPAMYGFQSYISVPIKRKDGSFFGTLCAIDPKPNKLNTPEVIGMFTMFADLISFHLSSAEQIKKTESELSKERALHKKLEENKEKLNVVIEASELGIWEVNLVSKELISYGRFPEILGYTQNSLPSWDALGKNIHNDDHAARARAYEEAFKTGKLYLTTRTIWPDGSMHWLETRGRIFFDDEKNPVSMMGATRDITDEKIFSGRLEQSVSERTQQLNDKNAELEKMNKELESFAYISSHDLQEPLRKIQTFAAFIAQEGEEHLPEKVRTYVSKMQSAAGRMQVLINDLLAYSRTGTAELRCEKTDVSRITEDALEDLAEEIRRKDAIVEVTAGCVINVIPFQMRQLFQNLVSNALKFAAKDRRLHIKIESRTGLGKEFGNAALSGDTEYCRIKVSDNGIGFENQYREKIFELFQRLHGRTEYNGTGIGLAIVKKIVENHHGIITAEGKPGKGAEFDIYLPKR